MHTLQSPRARWSRANAPEAIRRRSAAREAASIAGPAPAYPPTAPLHGEWLGGCINGHTVILRLMRDSRHRSDQWAAELDGEVIADAAGLTRLWQLLHPRFPKAQSRRAMAVEQCGHTERDEVDAMAFACPIRSGIETG
jgi:hypothetical protein